MNGTALEVLQRIQDSAGKHKADIRRAATMEPGEFARQGDICVLRLLSRERPDLQQAGKRTAERQLAPGNTKGSRHVVASSVECEIYAPHDSADALQGPVIIARSRLLVEHPEHGHLDLPPGFYQVTYQRDYAKERADEIRRVMD